MRWWYLLFSTGAAFLLAWISFYNDRDGRLNTGPFSVGLCLLGLTAAWTAGLFREQAKRIAALETEVAALKDRISNNAATPSS